MRDLMMRHLRKEVWVRIGGEPGYNVVRDLLVYPNELTDQFEIVTPFTNEYAEFARLSQQLIAILKLGAAYGLGANTYAATVRIIMQSMNIAPNVIDAFMDTIGSKTTPFQEVEMLAMSPATKVVVRTDDNSQLALMVLDAWKQANPDKVDWPNVAEYEAAHLLNFAAQQQAMMMQQEAEMEMERERADMKENPNTRGRIKSDQVAMSKDMPETEAGANSQRAQAGSERSGPMLDAGMTGRGA
jgi:hypothetical protein